MAGIAGWFWLGRQGSLMDGGEVKQGSLGLGDAALQQALVAEAQLQRVLHALREVGLLPQHPLILLWRRLHGGQGALADVQEHLQTSLQLGTQKISYAWLGCTSFGAVCMITSGVVCRLVDGAVDAAPTLSAWRSECSSKHAGPPAAQQAGWPQTFKFAVQRIWHCLHGLQSSPAEMQDLLGPSQQSGPCKTAYGWLCCTSCSLVICMAFSALWQTCRSTCDPASTLQTLHQSAFRPS